MSVVAILGAQWGDEGKGKITDFLSSKAHMVIRYQGGNNAGHSIVIKGVKYALNLLPSGIFNSNVKNVLSNGMVINPVALLDEIEKVKKQGIKNFKLFISDRAHVVMPYHIELDELQEQYKGARKIGTTKKGIGPAYTDKYARDGIRIIDLYDDALLKSLISENLKIKNIIFKAFNKKEVDAHKMYLLAKKFREQIKQYVTDTSILINEEIKSKKNVLFEGAQGVLLCIDHGTYPFVTSSSPTSSFIPFAAGIGPNLINSSLGVTKAYTTRVGTGGFPTELIEKQDIPLQNYIRETGKEFGTVTGRPRRIGWFDAVAMKYSVRITGINHIALTLLDVLTGIKKLKICTHYIIDGKKTEHLPASEKQLKSAKPVYIELPGWDEEITKVKSFNDLPKNAKNYIKKIEELVDSKVSIFSVGPDREQTIEIKKLF